jgi:hypothetical protein
MKKIGKYYMGIKIKLTKLNSKMGDSRKLSNTHKFNKYK